MEIDVILWVTGVPFVYHMFYRAALPLWVWELIRFAWPVMFLIEEIRKWLVRQGVDILSTC